MNYKYKQNAIVRNPVLVRESRTKTAYQMSKLRSFNILFFFFTYAHFKFDISNTFKKKGKKKLVQGHVCYRVASTPLSLTPQSFRELRKTGAVLKEKGFSILA